MEGCLWYFIHEVFIIDSSGPSRPMFRRCSKNNKFLPLAQAWGDGREGERDPGGRAGPASNLQPRFSEGIFWPGLACSVEICVYGGKKEKKSKLKLNYI